MIKIGSKVRILNKEEMTPKFIDEIGRLHFDLGDGSDIVFNKDMEKYCDLNYKIAGINQYLDRNNQLRSTFYLQDAEHSEVSFFTFTLNMVEVID